MKVETIVLGRAIRIMTFQHPPGGIYLPTIVNALRDRYGFLGTPHEIKDLDEAKGINFSHGQFMRQDLNAPNAFVIRQFSIYNTGLVADTNSSTDDAQAFLEDIIKWGQEFLHAKIRSSDNFCYLSNIEFSSSFNFDRFLTPAEILSTNIGDCLKKYGIAHRPYQFFGFSMNMDRMNQDGTQTPSVLSSFILERREGHPFNSNLYFSSAPLRTVDHIALLKLLEELG